MVTFSTGGTPGGVNVNGDFSVTFTPTLADMQAHASFTMTYSLTYFDSSMGAEETVTKSIEITYID